MHTVSHNLYCLQGVGFFLQYNPHAIFRCHDNGLIAYVRNLQLRARFRVNAEHTVQIGNHTLCGVASDNDHSSANDSLACLINHRSGDVIALLQLLRGCRGFHAGKGIE